MRRKPSKIVKRTPWAYASVPKLWPGGTVVCIASGPSLTKADVDYVRGKVDGVIVINNNYQLAPWADVLYATDARWWLRHKDADGFKGLKYSLSRGARAVAGVQILKKTYSGGLSLQPDTICNVALNSGYGAINLAVLLGAKRILLLGYDMQLGPNAEQHWHKNHPSPIGMAELSTFRKRFVHLVEPLKAAGVEVINCTRRTALDCFRQQPLREVLPACEAIPA